MLSGGSRGGGLWLKLRDGGIGLRLEQENDEFTWNTHTQRERDKREG